MSALSSHRKTILCLLLVLATLAAYAPAFRSGFVNYDDLQYVTQNTRIHAGLTWNATRWAMSAFYQSNWHPLTWMSHALDSRKRPSLDRLCKYGLNLSNFG